MRKYFFNKYLSGLLFIFLTIIAIVRALQHFYVVDIYELVQYSLLWHIPFNLFLWWSWFLFIPLLYWITIRILVETFNILYWVIVCFFLPIVILLIRQTAASLITTLVLVDKSDYYALLYWRLFSNPWIWLDIIVYFAIIIGIRVVEYQQKSKHTGHRFTQLQAQLNRSQLNALRSQLHPHFLFNTFNTVSTLILKADNTEAERMLSLLENFLRTTVFENERQEVTLKEELRFVKDYLEIEKVRFSDKLEVEESIAGETLDARVPNFLLQPIVENAIYHAIAPKISQGLIRITSKKEDEHLLLIVEDNGPGLTGMGKKKSKEGLGLKITKERLAHLFGGDHQFKLEDIVSGGVRVTIQIPFLHNDRPVYAQ